MSALRIFLFTFALMAQQVLMACSDNDFALYNRCNGKKCIFNSNCASGKCFKLGDSDDEGYCVPKLEWWAILLIVLGSILLVTILCALICCCCRRKRNDRLSRKLDIHHHYYDSNGKAYTPVAADANANASGYQYPGQVPPNQMR